MTIQELKAQRKSDRLDAEKRLLGMSYDSIQELSGEDSEKLCDFLCISTLGWDDQLRMRIHKHKSKLEAKQKP